MRGLKVKKGRSILSLFAFESESPILIIGERLRSWSDIFPKARYCVTIHTIPDEPERYDLILLDGSAVGTIRELVHVLAFIKQRMSNHGVLMLLVKNKYSLGRVKSLIKLTASNRIEHAYSYWQIMNAARCASFSHICAFLPFPEGESDYMIDEMVTLESRFLEIPHFARTIKKIMHSIGKYYLIHGHYAVLCAHNPLFQNSLFEKIKASLIDSNNLEKVDLLLERFDIRDRGGLVLFLNMNKENKTSYIVTRVVHGLEHRELIKKNHDFLSYLHGINEIDKSIKTKLPTPLVCFSFEKLHIFTETLIPGVLAYKVNNKRNASRILKDAKQFSLSLSKITGSRTYLDKNVLDDLFREDEIRIIESKVCSEYFKKILIDEVADIKSAVAGKYMWLAASHGDYGYGNILVDPTDGRLTGVIDWNTGRAREFSSVDLVNMAMQRRRIERRMNIKEAIIDVIKTTLKTGGEEEGLDNISPNTFIVLAHVTLIRDISRSLMYADLFQLEQEDKLRALQALRQNYPIAIN